MWESDIVIYKKLIAVGCFKEPKYKTWFKKGSWSAVEAACLFNGIDIHSSSQAAMEFHRADFPGTKTVIVGINLISDEDNERYKLSDTDLWVANYFLDAVNKEAEVIENCRGYSDPLLLTNSYMQRNEGEILPKKLLKFAKEFFWDLYQKRNDSDFNKEDWKRCWHENISEPFLQLIADKENALLKKDESTPPETNKTLDNVLLKKDESVPSETNKANEEHIVKQDKEKIKIILEESAKAREKRVRNRGLEIYRDFKEKYPNKKITKEDVARQIMQEEAALYGFISKEQPLKKQPVLGTYLKELRRGL